jgi:hypothetical protein
MNMKTIVAVAVILTVLGAGYVMARPGNGGSWGGMMGGNRDSNGMMGSNGNGVTGGLSSMMGQYAGMMSNFGSGIWNGMMSGYRGMMGYGNGVTGGYSGMMGGNGPGNGMMGYGNGTGYCGAGAGYTGSGYGTNATGTNATPITIDKAKESVDQYLASTGNADLKLSEVIEFDNNFYAGVKEQSTGTHAFELLVNKYTGAVFPEMGPNMMWNTKYGHMNWNTPAQTNISEEQALKNAQNYLDKALPGTKVGNADAFYGYYTIEVQKDGKIYGMLSVNSYTGAVWYHNWHGAFVKIQEVG